MLRATLAIILILSVIQGLQPVNQALGSVEPLKPVPLEPSVSPGKVAEEKKGARQLSSLFFARIKQDILAKFRPVERSNSIDFDAAEKALSSKTTIEKVFNEDFEKKMRAEYAGRVQPFESTATNPIWRARHWEKKRYEDGQNNLASWTAREVLDDQLREFFHGGDKDSAPMKILSTAHKLSGGDSDDEAPKLSKEEKIARSHRRDLPPAKEEEESTPTRLKTKINVIKQQGALVFSNPIATTSVNGSREDVSVNMNKEFRQLTLRSNLNYGVKEARFNFNVNKKITDEVSLDLDHYAYTGGKRGASGEKSKEQAKVNYSVSF